MRIYKVVTRLDEREIEKLDGKRGSLSRSAYVRMLINLAEIKVEGSKSNKI